MRGQRGAAARAVGHDLVALVQQALVPDLLQRPPDGLDVVVVQRVVGVVGVDPEADPLGQLVPLLDVPQDRLAALGVELGHAVGLDVVLGLEAQFLLDLQLDREAVGVPAALAVHQPAAHGAVAREHVLEHAAEHVVRGGAPVGRRRALVEDVGLRALAPADRLSEHVALAPALQDLLLERGKGLLRIDGGVAGHRGSDESRETALVAIPIALVGFSNYGPGHGFPRDRHTRRLAEGADRAARRGEGADAAQRRAGPAAPGPAVGRRREGVRVRHPRRPADAARAVRRPPPAAGLPLHAGPEHARRMCGLHVRGGQLRRRGVPPGPARRDLPVRVARGGRRDRGLQGQDGLDVPVGVVRRHRLQPGLLAVHRGAAANRQGVQLRHTPRDGGGRGQRGWS